MSPYPTTPSDASGPMRLVLASFPSDSSARSACDLLLTERLAACTQSLPIRSAYWWRGRIESSEEFLVLAKTLPKKVGALLARLAEIHPYEVPEILELDVPRASEGYLAYLSETLDGPEPSGSATRRRRGSPKGRGAAAPPGTRARRPPR